MEQSFFPSGNGVKTLDELSKRLCNLSVMSQRAGRSRRSPRTADNTQLNAASSVRDMPHRAGWTTRRTGCRAVVPAPVDTFAERDLINTPYGGSDAASNDLIRNRFLNESGTADPTRTTVTGAPAHGTPANGTEFAHARPRRGRRQLRKQA
jgi:hypothetical protein